MLKNKLSTRSKRLGRAGRLRVVSDGLLTKLSRSAVTRVPDQIFKNLVKRPRECLLTKIPTVVQQSIVNFLSQEDVVVLQKTCEHFRGRYLKILSIAPDSLPEKSSIIISRRRRAPSIVTRKILYYNVRANICELRAHLTSQVSSIESCAHLRKLDISGCFNSSLLTDLSQKRFHPELEIMASEEHLKVIEKIQPRTVDLANTAINTLSNLKLEQITDLNLSGSKISDFSSIGASSLKSLDLTRCAGLENVEAFKHITNLNLRGNTQLKDVSALGISQVKCLNLSETSVEDVSMLGHIHTLNLAHLRISDVSKLGNVQFLNLRYTYVQDVSALGRVHNLDISSTQVADVSALGQVHTLNISFTKVLDVSALGQVHTLNISYTGVLDVSALRRVHTLIFRGATITRIPVTFRTHTLDLCNSKITDVDTLKRVHTLYIVETGVIDISMLSHTRCLDISDTKVTSLRGLKRAEEIRAHWCKITDFGDLKRLRILDIPENKVHGHALKFIKKLHLHKYRDSVYRTLV